MDESSCLMDDSSCGLDESSHRMDEFSMKATILPPWNSKPLVSWEFLFSADGGRRKFYFVAKSMIRKLKTVGVS